MRPPTPQCGSTFPTRQGTTSSHLHATIGGSDDKYFLVIRVPLEEERSGIRRESGIQSVDVSVNKYVNVGGVQQFNTQFTPFGTWIITHALTRAVQSRGRRRANGSLAGSGAPADVRQERVFLRLAADT